MFSARAELEAQHHAPPIDPQMSGLQRKLARQVSSVNLRGGKHA